jgi:hypothetical protein
MHARGGVDRKSFLFEPFKNGKSSMMRHAFHRVERMNDDVNVKLAACSAPSTAGSNICRVLLFADDQTCTRLMSIQ